jgi:dienelactone hydrolase
LETLPVIKELPDPFLMNNGRRVSNRQDWLKRREEIAETLLRYEYGHLAPSPGESSAVELSAKKAEDIEANEKQLSVSVGGSQKLSFRLILTIPSGKGPFPVVVKGDLCWGRIPPSILASAVRRGYIVAEFDRTEFAPDGADRSKGVYPLYPDNDWAALAGWAWGYHRTVDFLFTQAYVDKKRVAITGHSRGGKAALLAGALDERVALTAPNGSGCGGGGCFRVQGEKSEDIGAITGRFPYWFHPRLALFVAHVEQLPFDQHFLKALVAPRALLGTEALGDLWANPLGSQVSHTAAREVYRFLGAENRIGIHFRAGKHEQNVEDWNVLMDFADAQFFGRMGGTRFDRLAFSDAPVAFTWRAPAP